MRTVIAGAAVLCLLAAQPASAAWTTGGQGVAGTKAGRLAAPTPTCANRTVQWPAVGGSATYAVHFANGNTYQPTPDVVTSGTTAQAPGRVNVLVKAVVGSWSISAESAGKICS